MVDVVKEAPHFNRVGNIVVPDAEIDCQSPRHSPVVLGKYADIGLPGVAYGSLPGCQGWTRRKLTLILTRLVLEEGCQ